MLFACGNADSLGEELYARVTSSNGVNGVVMLPVVGGVCPQYNFCKSCKWCKGSGGGLGTYLEITASPLHMVYTIDTIYDSGATQPGHHNWRTCLIPIINKYTHPTSQHKLTLLTPFTRTVPPFPLPLLHHERHTQFTPAGYATPIPTTGLHQFTIYSTGGPNPTTTTGTNHSYDFHRA